MKKIKSNSEKLDGITIALTWAYRMRSKTPKQRKAIKKLILDRVRLFDKGAKSKEGEKFYQSLKSEKEWEFVGFCPFIPYIKADSEFEDHLNSTWIHPYSMPTLVYKHKKLPMIIHVNPEISYNNSIVYNLNKNKDHLKDIVGIMG